MTDGERDVTIDETACPLCGPGVDARCFTAREMMFGMRDVFDYLECASCGSLRIARVPENPGRYYPADHHSLAVATRRSPIVRWLVRRWADRSFGRWNVVGALLRSLKGDKVEARWVLPTGLPRTARMLDVGSGAGASLLRMRECGFSDMTGVDPFVSADIDHGPGLRIRRAEIGDVTDDGGYDLVVFNHSLEHVPDQPSALRHARRLVRPGGWVLVRVPVVNEAWRRYGSDWAELDPPRHLAVHSPAGLEQLAAKAGLALERIVYDSDAYELWASEQVARDIALNENGSWIVNPKASPFTRRDIRRMHATVADWNRQGLAGRASFYFRPVDEAMHDA